MHEISSFFAGKAAVLLPYDGELLRVFFKVEIMQRGEIQEGGCQFVDRTSMCQI